MKTSPFLMAAATLAAVSISQAATVNWTTGGTGSGTWDGTAATFNGTAYTGTNDFFIDGSAVKTVTVTGTVATPNSLTVSNTFDTTLTGSSIGGTLTKTGSAATPSNLTLASANTFGDVTIDNGKFILTNAAALGTTGTLNVNSGAAHGVGSSYGGGNTTFFYDAATISSSYTLSKNITFGAVASPTTYGMAMRAGASGVPLTTTLSGNLTGASNVTLWLDVSGSTNLSTWTLSGNNSQFAGNIRLNRGTIQFNSAASMGTGAVFVQTNASDGISAAASLAFAFGGTVNNAITVRAGSGSAISIDTGANNVTLTNTLTLSGNAGGTGGSFNKIGTGTLAVTGTVDTLLRKNGSSVEATPIEQGVLGDAGGNVTANIVGGTLDVSGMTGSTLTLGTLTGSAGTTLKLGAKTLALNGTCSTSFAGTLSSVGGSLLKGGTGTLTIASAGTIEVGAAGVTVSAGGLTLAGTVKLTSGTASLVNNATLTAGGTLDLNGQFNSYGGSTYQLITGSGTTTGTFTVTGYNPGAFSNVTFNAATGQLNFTAVPEPSTYGLLGAGALAAAAIVRRRRKVAPTL